MQKVVHFLFLISIPLILASFNRPKKEKINWISLSELEQVYKNNPKPIIIDIYTSWCGWCKVMDKNTYSNQNVTAYVNKNYYAVKLNAETTDSLSLGDKKFGFNPTYKANGLVVYLLSGRMGYPSTVLLTSPNAIPAPLSGYMKPSEFEPPLKYFGEGAFNKQEFSEYVKAFEGTW